ncbi:MAG: IS200/IS605 family transposase [Bacteroidota bacterium]
MSYVRIWVHLVFATKFREPWLTKNILKIVRSHIIENCKEKDIFLQKINGHVDHMHCLVSLGKQQSISEVAQLIKGESSYWINKNKLLTDYFNWQDDYYAVSVSESQVDKVSNYINRQEQHHKNKTFQQEEEDFILKFGFERLKD